MIKHAGFTLIELLIVIGITILLISGGLAAYVRLNNRQLLINSGKQLQLLMRTAQKQARVGSKPSGCDRLLSYGVQVVSGQLTSAQLNAECQNGVYLVDSVPFDQNVTSTGAFNIHFLVLQGGVANQGTFVLQRGTQTATFSVDQGGQISDVVLE
jgi:Tfp pilus assembly protein FimT